MEQVVLYHNPRWGKSRSVVALLKEKKIPYSVIEYLKKGISKETVLILAKKLNKDPIDFIRKGDLDFKKRVLAKDMFNNSKMAEFVEKYPKVLERPIVVRGQRAIIGRPPESILKLFN